MGMPLTETNSTAAQGESRYELAEHISEGFLAVDARGRIVAFNAAAEDYSGLTRQQALGAMFRDVFPLSSTRFLEAQLAKIRKSGAPIVSEGPSTVFADRYVQWRIFPEGDRVGIVFTDLTDRRRDRQEMLDHKARLAALFEQSSVGLAKIGLGGNVVFANAAFIELTGRTDRSEVIGRSIEEYFRADDGPRIRGLLAGIAASRAPARFELMIQRTNAQPMPLSVGASLVIDESNTPIGFSIVASDISHRMTHEEHRRRVDRELDHRMRNLMSLVQNLARRTAATSPTLDTFLPAFDGRLVALAAAQNLIVHQHGNDVPLKTLIDLTLAQQPTRYLDRITLMLPDVRVDEGVATVVAMSVHELICNAIKFGSLSNPLGTVSVIGDLGNDLSGTLTGQGGDERRLRIEWREDHGPPTRAPSSIGFGLRFMATALKPYGGKSEMDWTPNGLIFRFALPLSSSRPSNDSVGNGSYPRPPHTSRLVCL